MRWCSSRFFPSGLFVTGLLVSRVKVYSLSHYIYHMIHRIYMWNPASTYVHLVHTILDTWFNNRYWCVQPCMVRVPCTPFGNTGRSKRGNDIVSFLFVSHGRNMSVQSVMYSRSRVYQVLRFQGTWGLGCLEIWMEKDSHGH